jgi:hypothetical protein
MCGCVGCSSSGSGGGSSPATTAGSAVTGTAVFPVQLRSLCHCLYLVVSRRFPETAALGTVLFLRFVNPAIGNPHPLTPPTPAPQCPSAQHDEYSLQRHRHRHRHSHRVDVLRNTQATPHCCCCHCCCLSWLC